MIEDDQYLRAAHNVTSISSDDGESMGRRKSENTGSYIRDRGGDSFEASVSSRLNHVGGRGRRVEREAENGLESGADGDDDSNHSHRRPTSRGPSQAHGRINSGSYRNSHHPSSSIPSAVRRATSISGDFEQMEGREVAESSQQRNRSSRESDATSNTGHSRPLPNGRQDGNQYGGHDVLTDGRSSLPIRLHAPLEAAGDLEDRDRRGVMGGAVAQSGDEGKHDSRSTSISNTDIPAPSASSVSGTGSSSGQKSVTQQATSNATTTSSSAPRPPQGRNGRNSLSDSLSSDRDVSAAEPFMQVRDSYLRDRGLPAQSVDSSGPRPPPSSSTSRLAEHTFGSQGAGGRKMGTEGGGDSEYDVADYTTAATAMMEAGTLPPGDYTYTFDDEEVVVVSKSASGNRDHRPSQPQRGGDLSHSHSHSYAADHPEREEEERDGKEDGTVEGEINLSGGRLNELRAMRAGLEEEAYSDVAAGVERLRAEEVPQVRAVHKSSFTHA